MRLPLFLLLARAAAQRLPASSDSSAGGSVAWLPVVTGGGLAPGWTATPLGATLLPPDALATGDAAAAGAPQSGALGCIFSPALPGALRLAAAQPVGGLILARLTFVTQPPGAALLLQLSLGAGGAPGLLGTSLAAPLNGTAPDNVPVTRSLGVEALGYAAGGEAWDGVTLQVRLARTAL